MTVRIPIAIALVFSLCLAGGHALDGDLPTFYSSTTVSLAEQQLTWIAVPDAASYQVTIEPVPLTSLELLSRASSQERTFATQHAMLLLNDALSTASGEPVPWSDQELWPAARYRWHVEAIYPSGIAADVASGEFFKGIIERYGPARQRHPPLLFVHGFGGTPGTPESGKALISNLTQNEQPDDGRTSSLTYFADPATTDGRECWVVGYPNADSITCGAAVLRGALEVIRDRGTFPWWRSPRVDAICGSMGALVMRYVLERMPPVDGIEVDRIVFFGGPHRGTNAAALEALLFDLLSALSERLLAAPPAVAEMMPQNLRKVLPVPRRWSWRWMAVVGYGIRLPELESQQRASQFVRRLVEEHNDRVDILNRLYYLLDDDGDGLVACASAELGNGRNVYINRFHSLLEVANWRRPERGEERRMVLAVKLFLR